MLKKLAELWLKFIFILVALCGILYWFYAMYLFAYIAVFGDSIMGKILCVAMVLFMLTVTAWEILDYS